MSDVGGDVRKGYIGCYGDGDGPYVYAALPSGNGRTLPTALTTNGLKHEQCAHYAAQAGYEVFALQATGWCLMGTLGDVAQMKRKLDDVSCSTVPCLQVNNVTCRDQVNKVYLLGAFQDTPLAIHPECPATYLLS
jgi:hypothetical protein